MQNINDSNLLMNPWHSFVGFSANEERGYTINAVPTASRQTTSIALGSNYELRIFHKMIITITDSL